MTDNKGQNNGQKQVTKINNKYFKERTIIRRLEREEKDGVRNNVHNIIGPLLLTRCLRCCNISINGLEAMLALMSFIHSSISSLLDA